MIMVCHLEKRPHRAAPTPIRLTLHHKESQHGNLPQLWPRL